MQSRRKFIAQSTLAAGALLSANSVLAGFTSDVKRLTILHTNDTHSRLEPFPLDGGKNEGLGGVAARATLISEIRQQEEQVLLLDAGDIFQGTPYFNIYKGEPEIKAMTALGYDAATMGNHDFDAGLENFANQLQHARFPILLCNYDFTGTPMENKSQPFKIFRKGGLKIGVTGVGIRMKGLVPDELFGNTRYLDPVEELNKMAGQLRNEHRCDMVICLSHLGYQYKDDKISDEILAKSTENVDLIIGGHTHTFLEEPVLYKSRSGSDVIVNQVGWAGIVLGRLDFEFSGFRRKNLAKSHTVVVGKKTNE
ncbi:MAG: metallophosphatase [Ferruginibacter sp.]